MTLKLGQPFSSSGELSEAIICSVLQTSSSAFKWCDRDRPSMIRPTMIAMSMSNFQNPPKIDLG